MTPLDIKSNLEAVQKRIVEACQRAGRSPDEVTLIAVTKTIEPAIIEIVHESGILNFGENRVQEAEKKIKLLSSRQPRPKWHMIGHLQSNKVKAALEIFDMIQSVDSLELAKSIDQRARQLNRQIPIFLQVNISGEETKSGFSQQDVSNDFPQIQQLPGIMIRGLMTIAPLSENPEMARPVFRRLKELRDRFALEHLSMGMTDDFEVAIEEGATMLRVGRAIFGERIK